MLYLHFDDGDSAKVAAEDLRALGGHARRLLADCVEHQGVTRSKTSKAIEALSSQGFIFVRDLEDLCAPQLLITPSLAGEEALAMLEELEELEEQKQSGKSRKSS
jgi:DNA-binding MarR family transcriptional regulator